MCVSIPKPKHQLYNYFSSYNSRHIVAPHSVIFFPKMIVRFDTPIFYCFYFTLLLLHDPLLFLVPSLFQSELCI
jgi:hypothetical protein